MFKFVITYVVAIVAMFFVARANASDLPPDYLKDAVITVTLKNGETHTFSANTHKVVRRGTKAESKEQVVVVSSPPPEQRKVNAFLFVGHGHTGMQVESMGGGYRATEKKGLVLGLGLTRSIHDRIKLGGMVQTNGTMGLILQAE